MNLKKSIKPLLTVLFFIFLHNWAFCQKASLINVSGKAEIRMEEADCIGEARKRVIDAASVDALENAFGRVIVQGTNTYIENIQTGDKVETNTQMNTIGNSMVKGEMVEIEIEKLEWIVRDKANPTGIENELWLLCEIKGKAREIASVESNFEVATLNCADDEKCKTSTFNNQDRIYFSFRSPVGGYLSIFMEDREEDIVYRLFPYSKMDGDFENAVPVQSDQEYVLFSEEHHKDYFPQLSRSMVDPIVAYTTKNQLFNRIFVVFSENEYKKPILDVNQAAGGIKTIATKKFYDWVSKNKRNSDFQVSNLDITISQ